jgi:hypothetical protein
MTVWSPGRAQPGQDSGILGTRVRNVQHDYQVPGAAAVRLRDERCQATVGRDDGHVEDARAREHLVEAKEVAALRAARHTLTAQLEELILGAIFLSAGCGCSHHPCPKKPASLPK